MGDDNLYRGVDGFLKLLDLSKWPQRNDREKKLGNFLQTMVATVIFHDTGAAATADGRPIGDSQIKTELSHWPIEPDIVNLRIHEREGLDNVYDFGIILDHDAVSSSDKDRTTIFKDQGGAITYALPTDLMRVSQRLAPVVGRSMDLTAAGFPSILCPGLLGPGVGTRGAISLNISRNQGFTDDGSAIGQLSHILTYPAAGKGSQAKGKSGPKELVLRADAKLRFGAQLGRFMDEPDGDAGEGSTADERRKVWLYLDTPAPPDDKLDTESNGKSNHEKIPKDAKCLVIHGVVRIPKTGTPWPTQTPHYDYSYHSRPTETGHGSGGSSGSGVATGGGSSTPAVTNSDPASTSRTDMFSGTVGPPVVFGGKTYRKHTTPGGLVSWVEVETTVPADGTTQAQQGHLEAQSPAFSQRTNTHKYSATLDAVGVMNDIKPAGYTTLTVTLDVKVSAIPAVNEWITAEVIVSIRPNDGAPGPVDFYGANFSFRDDATNDVNWGQVDITFKGFSLDAGFLEVYVVRRAIPPATQTASQEQLHVCRVQLAWSA